MASDGAINDLPYEAVDKEDDKEVVIEFDDNLVSEEEPPEYPEAETIKISVTDGAIVIATFDTPAPPEMSVRDLRAALSEELIKIDPEKKIRLLIFRGQILKDEQHVSDTKMTPGDTLQMLTCANTPPPEIAPPADTAPPTGNSPRAQSARALLMQLGVIQQQHQQMPGAHRGIDPHAQPQMTMHGLELQEEVERWASRVKIWTCMLLLLYSFKLLVGLSQSLETRQHDSTPTLAFSLLGFWVSELSAAVPC